MSTLARAGVVTRDTSEDLPSVGKETGQVPWSLSTTCAFRFCFLYGLFEWLPLSILICTSTWTLGWLNGPDWWGMLNRGIGRWTITAVLGLPEHSIPRFSANGLAMFLGMVVLVVGSLLVAATWTMLDRRTNDSRVLTWMHVFVRFVLASLMLGYGWHKVLPAQFPFTFDYFTMDLGHYIPNDLLWAFMGASRPYQVFAGAVEVAGGLLLLTRRTAMLGGLVSAAAMGNVLALDIAYDVPVKFLAGQVFLMTLFVLAPFARRLTRFFFSGHDTPPGTLDRLVQGLSTDRRVRMAGAVFAAWVVFANLLAAERQVEARERDAQTPLHGIWDVEDTIRNGASVPLLWTDSTIWRRIVIQSNSAALIMPMSTTPSPSAPNTLRYRTRLDTATKTIVFTPFAFSEATAPLTFSYTLKDADHLVLSGAERRGSEITIRMRRVDPSSYVLLGWERKWAW